VAGNKLKDMRNVAIVAAAQTKHNSPRVMQQTVRDIVYEVTHEALKKVVLQRKEVETVVQSSSDFWQGMGCSNVFHYESAGAYLKDSPKIEDDSLIALIQAYLRICSGHFDTALVVSATKCSEIPPLNTLTILYSEPIYHRLLGLNESMAAAMQCTAYCSKFRINEESRAEVSVKNFSNGLKNPYAHRRMKISIEEVMNSEVVAYPLRKLECPPASDGACAVLLASEEKARQITDTPIWIKGVGWCSEEYFLEARDLTRMYALRKAAKDAYSQAEIKHPRKQIDVAEVSEVYAYQELMYYEALGFCSEGEGARLLNEGVTSLHGELPINPSGGVLSTNPYVARGLIRAAECALQLMGEAGDRQVEDAETALAHSTIGLAGQSHAVVLLAR